MQQAAPIGISSDETKKLFQVYKAGILLGTLNASNKDDARQICVKQYSAPIDWRELKAVEVMRS